MKLIKILEQALLELGDASSNPYEDVKTYDTFMGPVYSFSTDYVNPDTNKPEPTHYIIRIVRNSTNAKKATGIEVDFGILPKPFEGDFSELSNLDTKTVTNKGELYRVMATVTKYVKKELDDFPNIKYIFFQPTKKSSSDQRRFNLYISYISKIIPIKSIEKDKGNKNIRVFVK